MPSALAPSHWLILGALLLAGVIVLATMIRALRAEQPDPTPEARPAFKLALALIAIAAAYFIVYDDPEAQFAAIERERALLLSIPRDMCPERRVDDAGATVVTPNHDAKYPRAPWNLISEATQ